MRSRTDIGRTFLLVAGFVCGTLAGTWLGLVAAVVSGVAASGPARFPGEDLAAALAAATVLTTVYFVVRRTEGRLSALDLLFVAAYAALDLLCSLYLFTPRAYLCLIPAPGVEANASANVLLAALQGGSVPDCRVLAPPLFSPKIAAAMLPAVLVTLLTCYADVRHSALLRSVGLAAGVLFAVAGLVLSLARAFA